ncbi:MAG: hypothetical protein ACJAV2_004098 [Myxococcota bacterium]|jgi:hypothetical protein
MKGVYDIGKLEIRHRHTLGPWGNCIQGRGKSIRLSTLPLHLRTALNIRVEILLESGQPLVFIA